MRMTVAAIALLVLEAVPASGSSINIYFDPNLSGVPQVAYLRVGVPLQVYVYAILDGDAAAGGISGAEFLVSGYGEELTGSSQPNPAANYLTGDPIEGGAQIAFPACQQSWAVLLYTITSQATAPFLERELSIGAHGTLNPNFPCARLLLCDAPSYTSLCVGTGIASVTGVSLGLESRSWSTVKSLYQ